MHTLSMPPMRTSGGELTENLKLYSRRHFRPLKQLLDHNCNVGLRLSMNTTYCFDSESFRYLAASKSGVEVPNKGDFDRSWSYSRDETVRMINYLKSVPPHETKSTMNFDRARQKSLELIRLMMEISRSLRTSISMCKTMWRA